MHKIALILLAFLGVVWTLPVKRTSQVDLDILKFADVLEQLETQFYTEAIQQFSDSSTSFQSAGFSSSQVPLQQFQTILEDETTHESALSSVIVELGGEPLSGCSFNFSSALESVSTMTTAARLVENVGVGAYLGLVSSFTDPTLITAAASIMTVESRHQTLLNLLDGGSTVPQAFDIALSPSEVLAIVGSMITGCNIGIPANPSLLITNTAPLSPGALLTFQADAINASTSSSGEPLFCQIVTGANSTVLPVNECVVPDSINGPMLVFITGTNDTSASAGNSLIAGPVMTFVDADVDLLSELVRSTNTTDDVPAISQASSVISTLTSSSSTISVATTTSTTTLVPSSAVVTTLPSVSTSGTIASFASSFVLTTTISPSEASALISSASEAAATQTASTTPSSTSVSESLAVTQTVSLAESSSISSISVDIESTSQAPTSSATALATSAFVDTITTFISPAQASALISSAAAAAATATAS